MRDDLLTPEELGEKLKRGEITREEAVEIMTERARREAFANLFGPMPGTEGKAAPPTQVRPWKAIAAFVVLLVAAMLVLWLALDLLS